MAFSSLPTVASDAVVSDVEAHISLAFSTGRLDLSYRGLEEVPLRVFQIVDLVDLSLAGNKISSLPDDIKNLVNVCFLSPSFETLNPNCKPLR
jgi:Leucine-rich repeat (LRR) protein